jgi:hypothetical protein
MNTDQLKQRLADFTNSEYSTVPVVDLIRDCRTLIEEQEQEIAGYTKTLAENVKRIAELEAELGRFKELHYQPDRVLETTQPCRRCGKPGAVLHFPGGWLCSGGCGSDVL